MHMLVYINQNTDKEFSAALVSEWDQGLGSRSWLLSYPGYERKFLHNVLEKEGDYRNDSSGVLWTDLTYQYFHIKGRKVPLV